MARKLHQLDSFRRLNALKALYSQWKKTVAKAQKERHIRCTVIKFAKEAKARKVLAAWSRTSKYLRDENEKIS